MDVRSLPKVSGWRPRPDQDNALWWWNGEVTPGRWVISKREDNAIIRASLQRGHGRRRTFRDLMAFFFRR
jgi:hypothetical protein